jgi:cysteine desulfurase family protein (TIGR01976 family)
MKYDVQQVRSQFPALSRRQGQLPIAFLDNPAGTQVPKLVVDQMTHAMIGANANLGGFFRTSVDADALVAAAHDAAATFVNARHPGEVFFGQNMTTLTFTMSRSIGASWKAGDEVVLSRMDHEANISPWLMLAEDRGLIVRWLEFSTKSYEFDLESLHRLMTPRTKLVAVCYASNITGTINDVATMSRIAHDAGALIYVDAVQYAPHGLIDVQAIDCDFLLCSAYKFFGPHLGLFWGRRELLQSLRAYKVRPAAEELPWRFSTGTLSREALAGVHAAIDYIAALSRFDERCPPTAPLRDKLASGFAVMKAHDDKLTLRLIKGLRSMNGVRILGITDPTAIDRRVSTVSFSAEGGNPEDIAKSMALAGLQVWSGDNYGVEPYRQLGLYERGCGVRVGPVHYNTVEEIDHVVAHLRDWLRKN